MANLPKNPYRGTWQMVKSKENILYKRQDSKNKNNREECSQI